MKHNRRAFLRGVGAAIALPTLHSLGQGSLLGSTLSSGAQPALARTATGAPLRTAFLYFPNGAIPSAWWPDSVGEDFQFSETLASLKPVRDSIQIMGGLDNYSATAGADGAGDHARGGGTFLTNVRLNKSSTDLRAGKSIDQVIAEKVGHLTRLPSLELSCEADRRSGSCDSGYSCAYQYNISWTSPTTPMASESNPRLVFERLFGAGRPGQRQSNLKLRRAQQKSVLDFVMEDARRMQKRLQRTDQMKLEEYCTSVREIEKRIELAERHGDAQTERQTPLGVPTSYAQHMQMMFDLMILAFQTDSTRVATFCLAHDGSNRSFSEIGVVEGHHELSHHQNKQEKVDKVKTIDRWYVQQLGQFLQRMEQTRDEDGNSLLHNSQIMFGSGNADGNRHTHVNLPIVMAGNGGGDMSTGRFVDYKDTPLANMHMTLAHRMGVTDLKRFGDSTGVVSDV
ncbi:DUF1552 domain-containing protein [Mariniblastus fucicola]|uniref:DUF1552 domain-containing protein n=1 Tax=Mariniblastus fucicola TaxID=980251 RepID=A0A5B9PIJ7_9BACT|nr:DUF1552 domain-containing protein [Mariniblastus fucicola]QEG24492.1 hypothetical protein MFFC18_44120 [Mariniblastus fucicola]